MPATSTTEVFGQAVLFRVEVPPLAERERVTKHYEYIGGENVPPGSTVKELAIQGYSKLFGAGAIYGITPCTQETAEKALVAMQPRKLTLVTLAPERALAEGRRRRGRGIHMTTSPDTTLGDLLAIVARLLNIKRALAVLDLETTGVNPDLDHIVELTIARVEPGTFAVQQLHTRVNPGVPIPVEASAIHGITDADVQDAPSFRTVAPLVLPLLAGADVVGFNHRRFDVRMIAAECKACDLLNPCEDARLIDVGLIFMKREPRTLEAAMRFFCGEDLEGAHGTTADVSATLRVLLAQFERYQDLSHDIDALDAIGRDPSSVDREGKIIWRGGKACLGFGKYQGVPLDVVAPSFLRWMVEKDFPPDTKEIVRRALKGQYPVPLETAQELVS
jgi:DNA polymerase-3 subunit epsilon